MESQLQKQVAKKGIVDNIIFVLLSILIIGGPLFKGLFFEREIMISNIFVFSIFLLFILNKMRKGHKLTFFNSPYDYIGLLFIVAYLLPIISFQWANLRDAIDMLIRYSTYYAIYLVIKDMVQIEKYKYYFTKVLILGSLVVAFIGILGAAGYIKLDDVIMGNRISSTFQYPNTLAALMMAVFFLVTGSIHKSERYMEKLIYGSAGFAMLFTFIFTYSRGAWLLLPIFALLYLIFVSGKDRIASILYFITVLIPNVLVLQPFTSQLAIDAETKPKALIIFLIGIGVFNILYSIVLFIESKLADKHYKIIYGFLGAIIVGVGIFGYMALNTVEPLVFDNLGRTENYTNQIQRTVQGVKENTEYTLKLNLESVEQSENEAHWPWRIRINSVNEVGGQELLVETLGEIGGNEVIEIHFSTLENTTGISLYFTNLYLDTKVVFNSAQLMDQDEKLVENIKLKYKYLPESLIARFNSIDLKSDNSAGSRLTFYKDSFSIFKAKPIFGGGGGTWEALYSKYQSVPYNSTEAHNYFLQTMIEAGIVGIVVLVILILALIVHLLKARKKKDTLTISVLFSILALLTHSGLDFNFSFHSIPIIFWALISLLEDNTFEDIKQKIKGINFEGKSIGGILPTVFGVSLLLFSISLYSAYAIATDNTKNINAVPLEESINKMEKAVALDPFHPNMRIDLVRMLRAQGAYIGDYSLVEKAESHLKKAIRYTPYATVALQEAAIHYTETGNFEEVFKYLDKNVEAASLKQYVYETKVNIYNSIANYYISQGQIETAVDIYKNNILGIIDEVRSANNKTTKPIQLDQNILQNIFRAKYFVDNYNDPEKLVQLNDIVYICYLDLDGATGAELLWNKSNSKEGDIVFESNDNGMKVYNSGEGYGLVYSENISLQPKTLYELELVFTKDSTSEITRARIVSRVGESIQFDSIINIRESTDSTHYFTFTTTDDIEAGQQYISFDHLGNNDDYFTIKQVIIRQIN